MNLEVVDKYAWGMEPSNNSPYINVIIKNIQDGRSILISDVVWATGRKDLLEDMWNTAIDTLNGGSNCCYQDKCSWIEEE